MLEEKRTHSIKEGGRVALRSSACARGREGKYVPAKPIKIIGKCFVFRRESGSKGTAEPENRRAGEYGFGWKSGGRGRLVVNRGQYAGGPGTPAC